MVADMNIYSDNEIINKAYKKLKSNVYYDKTNIILRDKIVDYESDNIEDILSDLWERFKDTSDNERWEQVVTKIIDSINCIVLPKSIKPSDNEIIANFNPESTINVDSVNTFIDMDVEGHLFGIIWLFAIGWKLDKNLNCCYANRIRKNLYNEFSGDITYSPYLFEPYFEKYESWRDEALLRAKTHLDKNEDVVVITLDFQRYYYSVDITEQFMDSLIASASCDENDILSTRLNDLIYKIIVTYSERYNSIFNPSPKKNILPIGFLPSNVIANWSLKNFDEAILNGWNPLYYGRYVDDILIVGADEGT